MYVNRQSPSHRSAPEVQRLGLESVEPNSIVQLHSIRIYSVRTTPVTLLHLPGLLFLSSQTIRHWPAILVSMVHVTRHMRISWSNTLSTTAAADVSLNDSLWSVSRCICSFTDQSNGQQLPCDYPYIRSFWSLQQDHTYHTNHAVSVMAAAAERPFQ